MHIAELLTQQDNKKKGVKGGIKDPLVLIDENYVGNFKIKRSMTVNAVKPLVKEAAEWLPCCFGGYFDIDPIDLRTRVGENGVFDCTCRAQSLKTFKPAWNGSVAQFPNAVYQYMP